MFPLPKNISASKSPICSSLDLLNSSNLSCLHKQALLIHPEWLNGFNAAIKKSIGIDKNIYSSCGINSTGLNGAQFLINYSTNNANDSIWKMPNIQLHINDKLSKLYICYRPSASFRFKFKNQIFSPHKFNTINEQPLSSKNILHADWFGKSTRISLSALLPNRKTFSTTLSILTTIHPNFECGAELFYHHGIENDLLEPCLGAAYSNEHFKLATSIWIKSSKIDISYFRRVNEQFQAGSIFIFNVLSKNAIGSLFCQYDFGNSVLRAKIASNGLIGGTYEFKIGHFYVKNSLMANVSTQKLIHGIKIGFEI